MTLGAVWSLQRRLIYFPDREHPPPAAAVRPGARDVTLTTVDGLRLSAWLVPAADRSTGEPADPGANTAPGTAIGSGTAVLVAPGNGGNRAGRLPLADALSAEGFTTLLMDYRGYGGNPGTPTEAGLALDVRAAWDYLTASRPPQRVILFGESLGAAVAAALAADLCATPDTCPGGLVLRSPFTSLADVGRAHYPWLPVRALLRDRYEVRPVVATIPVATAVVHGTQDSIVPPAQSVAVADAAARLVYRAAVPAADHNDAALAFGPEVVAAVRAVAG